MKRFIFAVIVALSAMVANAQMNFKYDPFCVFNGVHYWFEAGVAYSKTSYKSADYKLGYRAGFGADIPIYYSSVSFLPSVMFECKGFTDSRKKMNGYPNPIDYDVTAMYVEVPLDFSLNIPFGKKFGMQIAAGPYIGIGVGGKYTMSCEDQLGIYGAKTFEMDVFKDGGNVQYPGKTEWENKQLLKRFDIGADLGLRFIIMKYIMVKVNAELGFINAKKEKGDIAYRNQSFSAGVAFRY